MSDATHPSEVAYAAGAEYGSANPFATDRDAWQLAKRFDDTDAFMDGFWSECAAEEDIP